MEIICLECRYCMLRWVCSSNCQRVSKLTFALVRFFAFRVFVTVWSVCIVNNIGMLLVEIQYFYLFRCHHNLYSPQEFFVLSQYGILPIFALLPVIIGGWIFLIFSLLYCMPFVFSFGVLPSVMAASSSKYSKKI